MAIDYGSYEVLTFDCYGTLIDWETGLLAALRRALPALAGADDDELLEAYGRLEAEREQPPYRGYRHVLTESVRALAEERSLPLADEAAAGFAESVGAWPAFRDTPAALGRLRERYRLGVITNCDDDLFAATRKRLGVELDWVVTAEQARAYKPSPKPFHVALEAIGVPRERILHVAQSHYHDHVPAARLGLASVWIDRRHGRSGPGATPRARGAASATFPSLAAFAEAAVGPPG